MANNLMFQIGIERANQEYERIRKEIERLAELGDKGINIKVKLEEVGNLQSFINDLESLGDAKSIHKLSQNTANLKTQLDEISKSAKQAGDSQEESTDKAMRTAAKYRQLLFEIENQQAKLGKVMLVGDNFGMSSTILNQSFNAFERLRKEVAKTIDSDSMTGGDLQKLTANFGMLKSAYKDVISEAEKYNKTQEQAVKAEERAVEARLRAEERAGASRVRAREREEREYQQVWERGIKEREKAAQQAARAEEKAAQQAAKSQAAEYNALQKNAATARREAESIASARQKMLQSQAASLSKLMSGGRDKLDTYQYDQLRNALKAIREELRNIETIKQRGGLSTGTLLSLGGGTNDFSRLISYYQRFIGTKQTASTSNTRLTESELRLANAIKHSTDSMRGQNQVLSDLKSMALQYLGVWGAQNFIQNIIQIGGQLEMQRLSIGAILGDMAKATELFDKIKLLALKSPFGVVELDQMTKQLSAYGFEYKELYDMTRRLADISAATGTGVDRLALALGHVRSEAALSGYTLRQFSMANIPLAKKLSDHLSEVEGRFVSIAEVRKRVRVKDISYEDVLKVLKDLTDEGGMFYNAQEKMAESVKAKFKNLKDSMDIMYGEIAESSVGGGLKNIATLLTQLTRHWQELAAVLLTGAGYWSFNKIAMTANNKAILQGNLALGRFSAAQLEAAAITKNLTREQLLQAVATKRLSVADAEAAGAVFLLSKAQLQHVANTGKVSAAMNMATVATSKYTVSQLRMIATWRSMNLGWMAQGWLSIKNGATAAATAVGGLLRAFWPMLALSAVAEVFFSLRRESEQFAESANYVGQSARQMMTDINNAIKKVEKNGKPIDVDSLREAVRTMREVLDENDLYTEEQKKQVDNAKTISQKYDVLLKQMKDMREEAQWLSNSEDLFKKVLKNTGKSIVRTETPEFGETTSFGLPFFNKSLTQNIEQVNKSNSELNTAISLLAEYQDVMQTAIEENNGFGLSLKGKSWQEQVRLIAESGHWDEFVASVDNAGSRFEKMTKRVKKAAEKVRDDWGNIVTDDFEAIKLTLMQQFNMTEEELSEWAKNNERTYRWFIDGLIKAVQKLGVAEVVIDKLKEKLLGLFSLGGGKKPGQKNPTPYDLQTDLGKRILGNVIRYNKNNGKGGNGVLSVKEVNQLTGTGDQEKTESEVLKTIKDNAQKDYQDMVDIEKIWGKTSDKYIKAKKKYEKSYNIARANNISAEDIKGGSRKGGGKKVTDDETKEIREQVRLMKEAADSYQYWRNKVGEGSAFEHVAAEFGNLLKQYKLDSTNVNELRSNLEKLRNEVSARPVGKARTEALKEIDKELAQIDRKDFEKDTERFVSSMTREIEELTRKWDIFNTVVSDTGDRMLAARLSGVSPGATPADLKRENVASFAGARIDFSAVLGMSDEEIDEYVYSLGIAERKIKAVQNGLKDWKKAQQDVIHGDIQSYAKWLGSLVDLESIRMRNQTEYNLILEETNRLLAQGLITSEEAERRRMSASTERDSKNFEATAMYHQLYNNASVMAEGEFYDAYNKENARLFDMFKQGKISVGEYADKVQKLNKVASEFETRGFLGIQGGAGAYLNGGYQGLIGYHWNKASKLRSEGKVSEAKEEENKAKSMEKQMRAADQLVKAFDDLSKGANLIADMFDALGMEGASNAFGHAAGVLGNMASGASSLSAFGPYGMAVGAAIGGITSIAQLHDKKRERQIEDLRRDVQKIDNTLNLIRSLRERTLGYDKGNLRRQLAAQYTGNSDTDKAMYEYYSRGGLNGNGYRQELTALQKQREDYQKMYDAENGKKKKSKEALEEYKSKMAELDITIQNFAKDLADELFGIDLKGWADQIGDALMNAFENGEDAAEAFKDTVQDIMGQVVSRMMSLGIIQPMMERLQTKLFGKNGTGGSFDATNPEGTIDAAMRDVADFFGDGGDGQKMIEAAETFYENWQSFLKSRGLSLESSEKQTGASATIKSITEQTADLLASYLNAIRLDVSVDRALLAQYIPMFYTSMTSASESLKNIEQHTAAIMNSNEKIAERIESLDSNFRGLRSRTWRLPVE
jgi:hypothetical protein